jgi:hypothetical protein
MPVLDKTAAAFAGVIVIIIVGIVAEKKTVSWGSVLTNVLSFVILISTIDMNWLLIICMLTYLAAGMGVVHYKFRKAYSFFGCKTYGALALTLVVASSGMLGLTLHSAELLNLIKIFVLWFAAAICVHSIGLIYRELKK